MRSFPHLRLALLPLLLAACGDDDRGSRDSGAPTDGGTTRCDRDEDCDDGLPCTIDSCGVGNACRFDPIDERCPGAQICEVGRGCVDEPSCRSDEECDDGFRCTLDSCGVGGECRNMPLDELCSSAGPGSLCDPATGMPGTGCTEATGCTGDEDCDDAVPCTLDTCGVDMACTHTPVNERCDAGEVCTATGCFASMPCETDDDCQDGNFCNGREVCEPEFGCRPAPAPRVCDDSDPCTVDRCDTDADMCVFACDASMSGCACPTVEVPCAGVFDLTPAPAQTCAADLLGGGPPQVDYNVTEVEFTCVGPVVSVDGRNIQNPMANAPLTQSMRSTDGTFDVSLVVPGGDLGCTETYRLRGRFVDEDTFEATWTATYTGLCIGSGCVNQSIMVTGRRR